MSKGQKPKKHIFSDERATHLIDALASWLRFESLCFRHRMFREDYLCHAIGEFLGVRFKRGFHVRRERNHPVLAAAASGPGRKPSIDFAVVKDHVTRVAIETKWTNRSNDLAEKIIRDVIRLELLAAEGTIGLLIFAGNTDALNELLAELPLPDEDGELSIVNVKKPLRAYRALVRRARRKFRVPIASNAVVKCLAPNQVSEQYRVIGWLVTSETARTTFAPAL